MRIDSKYRMYWADGDCFAVLKRKDHILQYSATNQISEDGTYGLNLSYARNYYRKQGYTTGVYITFTEYGDYYAVYDNPFSSVYLAIPEEQSIELNQFNYWNVDIDYSLQGGEENYGLLALVIASKVNGNAEVDYFLNRCKLSDNHITEDKFCSYLYAMQDRYLFSKDFVDMVETGSAICEYDRMFSDSEGMDF